ILQPLHDRTGGAECSRLGHMLVPVVIALQGEEYVLFGQAAGVDADIGEVLIGAMQAAICRPGQIRQARRGRHVRQAAHAASKACRATMRSSCARRWAPICCQASWPLPAISTASPGSAACTALWMARTRSCSTT